MAPTLRDPDRRNPELPRFGLGCAQLGNHSYQRSEGEVADLLESAWAAGVRHFDTAPHYGLGLSERRLGRFLADKPRAEFVISTKVGRLVRTNPRWDGHAEDDQGFAVPAALHREWDFTPDGVRASLAESLDRLRLDRVDICYVHDPERSDDPDALQRGLDALAELRAEGAVDLIGTGSMTAATLEATARTGLADLLMVAGRYTLLNQTVVPEVLDACAATGTSIVAAALFHGGLLSGRPLTTDATFDYERVRPEMLHNARRLAAICTDHLVELPTAALHYPLRDSLVVAVMVGADTGDQVRQNLQRLHTPVPEELWRDLAEQGLIP